MKLSPHVRIEDIDRRHWKRMLELPQLGRVPHKRSRHLLIYVENGRARKAVHSLLGAQPIDGIDLNDLEGTRLRYDVGRVSVMHDTDVRRMLSAQNGVHAGADLIEQGLTLYNGIMGDLNGLTTHPKRKPRPLLPLLAARFAGGWMVPAKSVSAFFVTEGDKLWTSFLVGRGRDDVDLLTTARALEERNLLPERATPQALHAALQAAFGRVGSCLVVPKEIVERYNRKEIERSEFWSLLTTGDVYWDPCPIPRLLRI